MAIKSKGILKEGFNTDFANGSAYNAETLRNTLRDVVDSYKDEVQTLTQAEIDAIVSPQIKQMVYNSDLGEYQIYLGGWATVLTAKTNTRADELYYTFSLIFDGGEGTGAEGAITLREMFVPSSFVCYQTIWSASEFLTGSQVISLGVATDATNCIFSSDLDAIDEQNTKVTTPTTNLTKTTMQRRIVGSVAGGDVTQGTLTITAKFIRV